MKKQAGNVKGFKKKLRLFSSPVRHSLMSSHLVQNIVYRAYKPDKEYIMDKYKKKIGHGFDIDDPHSFTEKLQWIKLYDRKPVYTVMVDKILAKEYVASAIGPQYVIPTLKVWNSAKEIDFSDLPDQFVLKCNHNSGRGMVICKDKRSLDEKETRRQIKWALKRRDYLVNREWPYKNVTPRVFAEELVSDSNVPEGQTDGLIDYKFYCFNGKPQFLYIGFANIVNNKKHDYLSFYNLDFTPADFGRHDHPKIPFEIKKPDNFDEMIRIAEKLAEGTLFVRVDLYNLGGEIKFSEFTFFPGGGMARFDPDEAEMKIGEMIRIDKEEGRE